MPALQQKLSAKERMQLKPLPVPERETSERVRDFGEVVLGYSPQDAALEALRCIQCAKPPCTEACPVHTDIRGYLQLMEEGRLVDAYYKNREVNPLPAVCGRTCDHVCETVCVVGKRGKPVAIASLKRAAADFYIAEKRAGRVPKAERPAVIRRGKAAVVGAGPAGLTCAHDLAVKGYDVTVYEAAPVPGGMLWLGIPEFRLPRDVIEFEVEELKELGVRFRFGTALGREVTLEQLRKEHDAVFLGIGAHRGKKMDIPGENDFEGFLDAIVFLRRVALGDKTRPGDKVMVIGGGNSAIDAARTALRLGCSEVTIVYRRSRKEMPALPSEVDEAEREGVRMHFLAQPVRIVGKDGKVTGMECLRCELGEPDASGRRKPVPVKGSEFTINADVIVPAVSQEPDVTGLGQDHGVGISKWNSVVVDETTLATQVKGIFSGGDAVTGPSSVIKAIAAGHKAAASMAKYLEETCG